MPKTPYAHSSPVLGVYNPACWLTLAGALAAYAALALAALGKIELALVGLMLAGLADLLDGRLARRLKLSRFERAYGAQLDTVVDVTAFLVAPAAIILHAVAASWLLVAALGLFVLAGLVRLAHFNALTVLGVDQSTVHRGLPVTYIALFLPLLFLLQGQLPDAGFALLLASALALIGAAFLADIPVPKPRGAFFAALPLLAAVLVPYWLWRGLQ